MCDNAEKTSRASYSEPEHDGAHKRGAERAECDASTSGGTAALRLRRRWRGIRAGRAGGSRADGAGRRRRRLGARRREGAVMERRVGLVARDRRVDREDHPGLAVVPDGREEPVPASGERC